MKTTLLFLRHGKTLYTNKFPDLTDEGKKEAGRAAEEVREVACSKNIRIISSPAERARGTAHIIAGRLEYRGGIEEQAAIRCMDSLDETAAKSLWSSFPSARAVDHAYVNDPQFELGKIVEKRSVIQFRFFAYLSKLFEDFLAGKLPDVVIIVSHYEVLWNLTTVFDFKEPLIHGEVIKLELTLFDGKGNVVEVNGVFRKHNVLFYCELPEKLFAKQFSN